MKLNPYALLMIATFILTSCGTEGGSFLNQAIGIANKQSAYLTPSNAIGNAHFGSGVAVSDDGNTIVVGGFGDNSATGATWAFTRNGASWSQQAKLIANDSVGTSNQGSSVAISGDGNTIAIGAPRDNSDVGAVWIFARSGSTWSQVGSKIVANNSVGTSRQGASIALSNDGNTLLVGATNNNTNVGSAWIYTLNGNSWTQQAQLLPNDLTGVASLGSSVSISADGNTAAIGGPTHQSNVGAAWVFVRNGNSWTQQGSKLTTSGNSNQGSSVSLSRDGNTLSVSGTTTPCETAIILTYARSGNNWSNASARLKASGEDSKFFCSGWGGSFPTSTLNADGNVMLYSAFKGAKVFGRNGGDWIQLGSDLAQTNQSASSSDNQSLAITPNGKVGVIGNPDNLSNAGSVWIFTP